MKLLIALMSLVALANAVAMPSEITKHSNAKLWTAWKEKFNKQYESEKEELTRFTIWNQNLKEISIHNVEYEFGLHTYNMGLNKFSDLTRKEFVAKYTGQQKTAPPAPENSEKRVVDTSSLPSEVNWVKEGWVTSVKDQGGCTSCGVFGTIGSVEGQYFNATRNLTSLSTEQLWECTYPDKLLNCSHDGVYPYDAFNYLIKRGSISEANYPYTSGNGQTGPCEDKDFPITATITKYVQLPYGDEAAQQEAVAKVGPVTANINDHCLQNVHNKGVYYNPTCSGTTNHAVVVVGYGTLNGMDYWLIKNSWGTGWADQGYLKVARNKDNYAGIASWSYYPLSGDF